MSIVSNVLQKVIQIILREKTLLIVQYLYSRNYVLFSPLVTWGKWYQTGNKECCILKVCKFYIEKVLCCIYVNRIESSFFDM